MTASQTGQPFPWDARAPESRRQRRFVYLAVGVLAFLPYLGVLNNGFVYDDQFMILENERIRPPFGYTFLLNPRAYGVFDTYTMDYRPMTMALMRADLDLWGIQHPGMFHLTNVILHMLVSLLVVRVAFMLGFPLSATLVAGLLFAVHPIHTEAVAWIKCRADILSSLFCLLVLIFHCRRLRRGLSTGSTLACGLGAALCFAVALLSKKSAIAVVPVCILVSLITSSKERIKGEVLWNALLVLVGVSYFWIDKTYLTHERLYEAASVKLKDVPHLWAIAYSVPYYAARFFWPVRLSIVAMLPKAWQTSSPFETTPGLVVVLGLCWLALGAVTAYLLWRGTAALFRMGKGGSNESENPPLPPLHQVGEGKQVPPCSRGDIGGIDAQNPPLPPLHQVGEGRQVPPCLRGDSGGIDAQNPPLAPPSPRGGSRPSPPLFKGGYRGDSPTYTEGKAGALLFLWLWFLIGLAPISNLVAISGRNIAEQRLYWPSIPLCLLIGMGFHWVPRPRFRRWATIGLSLILAAMVLQTVRRVRDWADDWALWSRELELHPDHPEALGALGITLLNQGQFETARKYLERSMEIDPNRPDNRADLALAYLALGDPVRAERLTRDSLMLFPNSVKVREVLARILAHQKRFQEAFDIYEPLVAAYPKDPVLRHRYAALLIQANREMEALEEMRVAVGLQPGVARFHLDLAKILENRGQADEAIEHYRLAAELDEEDLEAGRRLFSLLRRTDRTEEAIERGLELLARSPADATSAAIRNNIAYLIATSEEVSPDRVALAVRLAEEAVACGNQDNPFVLDTLAVAYRRNGEVAKALETERKALALLEEMPPSPEGDQLAAELARRRGLQPR